MGLRCLCPGLGGYRRRIRNEHREVQLRQTCLAIRSHHLLRM